MTKLTGGTAQEVGFDPNRIAAIEVKAKAWVDSGRTPALALLIARHGKVVLHNAWGKQTYLDDSAPLALDHIFFLGSLSKVFTATAAMVVVDDGIVSLNRPLTEYIPELAGEGVERILLHHLLSHSSGFVDMDIMPTLMQSREEDWELPPMDETQTLPVHRFLQVIKTVAPRKKPGEQNFYCSGNIILIAEVIRRMTGVPFADFIAERVFEPMGMNATFLELPEELDSRVVLRTPDALTFATDRSNWRVAMGAGGGFSNASDLAAFCQMFLNGGRYGDSRILSRAAANEMTRNQIPGVGVATWDRTWFPEASWGLGWMVQGNNRWKYDHGALQPIGTFYHQGLGGTAAWGDKTHDIVGVYTSIAPIKSMQTMDMAWEFPAFQNMVTAAVAH